MITAEEFKRLKLELKPNTRLVAVSKKASIEEIKVALELPIYEFGENRLQDLKKKKEVLSDVDFHFIGHIQSNKIKDIVKYASMIQSVDRVDIIDLINQEAIRLNKVIEILIQVNTLNEEHKSGVFLNDIDSFVGYANTLSNVIVKGIMVIGPTERNLALTKEAFQIASDLFRKYKKIYPSMEYLSMGMSEDYLLALEFGSNLVRIGSKIFR